MKIQRFEDFKHIRFEKRKAIEDVRRIVKELNTIMGKYKAALPKSNMNENFDLENEGMTFPYPKNQKAPKSIKPKPKPEPKVPATRTPKKNVNPAVQKADINKLEAELADIEKKLKAL